MLVQNHILPRVRHTGSQKVKMLSLGSVMLGMLKEPTWTNILKVNKRTKVVRNMTVNLFGGSLLAGSSKL